MAIGKKISDFSAFSGTLTTNLAWVEMEVNGASVKFDASDFARLSQANTFASSAAGQFTQIFQNTSANAAAYAATTVRNDSSRGLTLFRTSSAYSTSPMTSGPVGEQGIINSEGNFPLVIGTNGTAALVVSSGQNFDFKAGTVTTNNASASEVGFKGLPQNSQAAGYTLVLSDAGKHIFMSSPGTYTIPANASVPFPIGTEITFFNNTGSNQTIAITSDVLTLAGTATTGSRTLAGAGIAKILKVNSGSWIISNLGGLT